MHVWFRQYAQQMGMQNVRAILPEQIDVLINTSISDTVNELVNSHVAITNDRIVTDNAKLGQVNALRTLYANREILLQSPGETRIYIENDSPDGHIIIYDFFGEDSDYLVNGMYMVDLSISYTNSSKRTSWYPVRIIDNMLLADTLQDFVLKPRLRSPIAVFHSSSAAIPNSLGENVIYDNRLELFLGKDYNKGNGIFSNNSIALNVLKVGYLKKPAKVCYRADIPGGVNTNCDLPAYLHENILKHAVDLYRVAIQGSLYANQQQQQAQQREIGRNNVRPDNEGYQQ